MATKNKNSKPEILNSKQSETKVEAKAKTEKKVEIKMTDMTVSELQNEVKKVREEIRGSWLSRLNGKDRDTRKIFHQRKQLAKLLTVLRQKAL